MEYDGIVRRLQIKLGGIFAIRHSMRLLSVLGFLLAVTVLIVRMIFSMKGAVLLWGLMVFVPGIVGGILLAFRQVPSRRRLHALVDGRNRCGGLLMACDEADIGEWKSDISVDNAIRVRWRWSRSVGIFSAAMVFVVFSFVIPQRYVNATLHQKMDISEDVDELLEQIDVLKEENIITDEDVAEFEEKLDQLQDTAEGSDPVKTWESLDHLKDSLKKKAEQAAADALSQTEELAQAETFADGLSKDGGELGDSGLSQAMAELASMTKDMALENEILQSSLKAAGFDPNQLSGLSAEDLEKLMKALKACKGRLSNCMGNLCKAGLVDLKMLKLCEKLGKCDSKGLMAFLSECEGMGFCEGVAAFCNGSPGRGGITRGRGDAPMMWGDLSTKDNTKFQEKILPQASMSALKDSSLVGISLGAPQVEEGAAYRGDGGLGEASASGGQAKTHKILPRHRGTVKRYFER